MPLKGDGIDASTESLPRSGLASGCGDGAGVGGEMAR